MSAVEIIAPDNSMKKYIKFVLGLILVSTMINPIIYLFTKGEQEIVTTIKNYERSFTSDLDNTIESTVVDDREKNFKENLNKNCDKSLNEQFKDKDFKSDVICSFDFEKMTYNIEKVEVGVLDKGIDLIEKITIGKKESTETISSDEKIDEEDNIRNYLSELLNISADKIEIYNLEG